MFPAQRVPRVVVWHKVSHYCFSCYTSSCVEACIVTLLTPSRIVSTSSQRQSRTSPIFPSIKIDNEEDETPLLRTIDLGRGHVRSSYLKVSNMYTPKYAFYVLTWQRCCLPRSSPSFMRFFQAGAEEASATRYVYLRHASRLASALVIPQALRSLGACTFAFPTTSRQRWLELDSAVDAGVLIDPA
jgi:hypothetical protein